MSEKRKILIVGGTVFMTVAFSVFFIFLGNTFFPREDVPTIEEGSIIAESWIRNFSSLYPLYGRDLQLIHREEKQRGEYEFVFSFISENPEYGVHENKIEIKTKNTEVVEAIANGIYDEIEGKYLEKEETVDIYFVLEREEEEESEVMPVERVVSTSAVENIEEALLEELFQGPSEEEVEKGYTTYIDKETRVFSFRIEEGVAYLELSIDFDQQLEAAKEQIRKTLMQLDGIGEVRAPERRAVVSLEIDGVPEDFRFTRDLEEGAEGNDVKYLQIILNADPETMVAQQGPGSPGNEVTSFGEATGRAVMAFQRKYADEVLMPAGLILSTGIVDEYMRDKLNSILEERKW